MSETFPSRNVLPFQRPDPVSEARNRKLFESLVTALQQPVQDLCGQVFQIGDDALFDRSERAGSSNMQNMHFETMRRLRLAKLDLSARAFEFVQAELARLLGTRNERYGRVAESVQFDTMSLVDPDTIESEVAANASANRVRNRYAQDFQALNKRFSTVQVTPADGEGINGFGPELFCLGFLNALTHFDCSLETRLVLLKLFERELLTACEGLLMRTHAALNACQVATEIPYRAFQRPAGPAGAAGSGGAGVGAATAPGAMGPTGPMTHAGPVMPHAAFAADQVVMQSLRELINALGLRYAAQNRAGPTNDAPVASPQDLAHAIQGLRLDLAAPSPHQQRTDALSAAIAEALSRQHDGNRVQIRPLDAGVIDLISLMFEYAVNDKHLPGALQASIARLQIPYLKLALIDPQFLAKRDHPARRLLDELAQAAVGWNEGNDRGLRQHVDGIVHALVDGFKDDTSVFEKQRQSLIEFTRKDGSRTEIAEKRAVQAADGKSKMEAAQRDAAAVLKQKLDGRMLPTSLSSMVRDRWSNYMVLTLLRHGSDSTAWSEAIRLLELIARFPRADAGLDDRTSWGQELDTVEPIMRKGLAATGVHDTDIDEVLSGLHELLRAQSVDAPVVPGEVPVFNDMVPPPRVRLEPVRIDVPVIDAPAPAEDPLAAEIEEIQKLVAGTWIEMQIQPDRRERVKLLWVSADKRNYLFVNANGIKVADKKGRELAEDLKAGRIAVLDRKPLVERAFEAAMAKVRQFRAEARKA